MRPIPTLRRALPAGLAMLVAVLAACTPPLASGPAPAGLSADSLYTLSISEAAVYRLSDVLPLNAIRPDPNGQVRVLTFTNWTGYHPGTDTLSRAIWVTQVPEVRDSCREFTGDLALRLEQLLGLPPGTGNTLMVEMTVPAAAMFRPAMSPDIFTRYPCGDTIQADCGRYFPPGTSDEHVRFMANQGFGVWAIPKGYPWTRLGYTYNWHPGSPRYGASEYLVRGGTVITDVQITDFQAYCGRST